MSEMSGKEEPKCTDCDNKAVYFCIVEDDIFACEYHLPAYGNGAEYFWEMDFNDQSLFK